MFQCALHVIIWDDMNNFWSHGTWYKHANCQAATCRHPVMIVPFKRDYRIYSHDLHPHVICAPIIYYLGLKKKGTFTWKFYTCCCSRTSACTLVCASQACEDRCGHVQVRKVWAQVDAVHAALRMSLSRPSQSIRVKGECDLRCVLRAFSWLLYV